MNANETAGGAAAAVATLKFTRRLGFLRKIPYTLYALIGFIILKLSVEDVRRIIEISNPYFVSWIEMFYLVLATTTMLELLRVSHPGIDNTSEALRMLVVAAATLVTLALSMTGIPALHIFNNTEFLTFFLVSACQTAVAFYINSRTLKRSMGVDVGSS